MQIQTEEVSKRRPVNLTIREDILKDAKELNLNASKAAEYGIAQAIKAARAQAWLEENKDALSAHNKRVEESGTLFRLTDPARFGGDPNDSFDVIIPSLPGFGFSGKPEHSGYNNAYVAELWVKLMTENLGYSKFAAAGGDIGSGVTRYMALNYPNLLTGIHLTDVGIIRDILMTSDDSKLSEGEKAYKKTAQQWLNQEAGYISIQSTKPQTLSYGFSDSPAGTAAWILEKFRSWSDCKGQLENSFSKDELLTNVMIYWLTNTLSSSVHMYYENTHSLPPMGKIEVPTGIALFSQDILLPPKVWAEKNLRIVQWTEIPKGGHFTAMEEPELFVEDISKFCRELRV